MKQTVRRPVVTAVRSSGDDRFRLLLDTMPDFAICMIGPQGMVLTWNEGAAKITGHTAEEIIGQRFSVFYPPEVVLAGEPRRGLEQAIRTGRYEDEGWRLRRDGSSFWASVVITPIRDREGRLRGFDTVTRDLSDRLRSDDLLAVLDAAVEPILGIDDDGRIIFTNGGAQQAFGYQAAELAGLPLERLFPSLLHEQVVLPGQAGQVGLALHEPRITVRGLELDGVRKDGTLFLAEVSLAAVRTARGQVVTATVRDITEQRTAADSLLRSQHRLERSEARLRDTLDAFAGALAVTTERAIIVTGADGRITFYNRGAELLLGHSSADLLGQKLSVLHDPDELVELAGQLGLLDLPDPPGVPDPPGPPGSAPDRDLVADYLQLAAGGPPRHWTYLAAGGARRPVLVTVTPVGDPYQPTGYLEIISTRPTPEPTTLS
jgi:PAS domain S-box-containing protein